MQPRIETVEEKKLVGNRITMSFTNIKTQELWQRFMPRRNEITNKIGTDLYSLEVFNASFFDAFDPNTEFEKWATVEVTDFDHVPDAMETLTVPSGLYAVFLHKGLVSEAPKTYDYIFRTWLPGSNFQVDNRPHFAVMGEKYKRDSPDSEEEIWIPVKPKANN